MGKIDVAVITVGMAILIGVAIVLVQLDCNACAKGPCEYQCIYDLVGDTQGNAVPCYIVLNDGSLSTTIPIAYDQCGQLEFACAEPLMMTWEMLGCQPKQMYQEDMFVGCFCEREAVNDTVRV